MKKTGLGLIAIALAFTTACGGSSDSKSKASDRPTAAEISKSLTTTTATQPQSMPKAQAGCAAKLLAKSTLSNKALKALVSRSKTYKPSTTDTQALATVGKTINKDCAA